MCRAYFAIYPCNHAVLASWEPCALATHPQNCSPRNLTLHVTRYKSAEPGLPPTCPGSKPGRPCLIVSPHPVTFAELCILKQITAQDIIALAPAWVYNITGDKIGTKARPYRLSDYVTALYLAKNPIALQRRVTSASVQSVLAFQKRKLDKDQESVRKKQKIEASGPDNDALKAPRSKFETGICKKGPFEAD